jgi:hypothetical protein
VERREGDNQYREVPLPVPLQFMWCLSVPENYTLRGVYGVDIGYIYEIERRMICSTFYRTPNNFRGQVEAEGCVRYYVELVADNYDSIEPYVIEVSWDGKWSDDPHEMPRHVKVALLKASA